MQTTETVSDYERERGKPMPGKLHGFTQSVLIALLMQHRDRYTLFSELTLELDDWQVTPDLSLYPKMTIDFTRDEIRMTEPPLLAVEIASPTQGMQELVDKIRRLLEAGVRSCWLVQPMLQTITVFSGTMEPRTYSQGPIQDAALDIEISADDVFRPQQR